MDNLKNLKKEIVKVISEYKKMESDITDILKKLKAAREDGKE